MCTFFLLCLGESSLIQVRRSFLELNLKENLAIGNVDCRVFNSQIFSVTDSIDEVIKDTQKRITVKWNNLMDTCHLLWSCSPKSAFPPLQLENLGEHTLPE